MKRLAFLLLTILVFAAAASALDFNDTGWSVLASTRLRNGSESYTVQNSSGTIVDAVYPAGSTGARAEEIDRIVAFFGSWTTLRAGAIHVFFQSAGADVLVVPRSFTFNGHDYLASVRAGLRFTFIGNTVDYDFRVLASDNRTLLRIFGSWSAQDGESALARQVEQTLVNPTEAATTNESDQLRQMIQNLRTQFEGQAENASRVEAENRQLQDRIAILEDRLNSFTVDNQALREALSQLNDFTDEWTAVTERLDDLQYALLMMSNRGLFGGLNMIDPAAVAAAVEIYTANPATTREEMRTQLTAGGFALSTKAVNLIYYIYFKVWE